jgi:hypothetical protein
MPDQRRHRGPHPEDAELFAPAWHPCLRQAVADLSWLLTRGYAPVSALKVVGDRHNLSARQRIAVLRSACSDQALASRQSRQRPAPALAGRQVLLDGYNILTTVEAAMAGGVVIVGRDGSWRDMASMHGTWRRVEETPPAIERIGEVLERLGAGEVVWYLDSPVSNSGRLKAIIAQVAAARGWNWRVELVLDPDKVLAKAEEVVVTADSVVLDQCGPWFPLAREIEMEGAWVLDLS